MVEQTFPRFVPQHTGYNLFLSVIFSRSYAPTSRLATLERCTLHSHAGAWERD
jgi:hypothetical protein